MNNLTIASNWIVASLWSRLLGAKSATFLEVLLMVFFCPVELLGRKNLSNNLPVQLLLLLFQGLCGCLLLFRCVKVYSRPVLCSHIITLSQRKNKLLLSTSATSDNILETEITKQDNTGCSNISASIRKQKLLASPKTIYHDAKRWTISSRVGE